MFSFSLVGLCKRNVEKYSFMPHMPYALAQFSAQRLLTISENTFRSEFLSINLKICCVTEKFWKSYGLF